MLRNIISIVRSLIVGPSLTKLSRLKKSEIDNIMTLSSEDPVYRYLVDSSSQKAAPETTAKALPEHLSKELSALQEQVTILSERVEVLERINKIKG